MFFLSAILKAISVYSFSQTVNFFCSLLGMDRLYSYSLPLVVVIIAIEYVDKHIIYGRRIKQYTLSLLPILLLSSCQNQVDGALELAGDNRQELETVLNHYKDDPDTLKYGAAKFLIENMPYHYTYQDADVLHYDSAYVAMAQEQEQYRDSVFMNHLGSSIPLKPVFDIQNVKADYLIRMIDDACETWHAASWSKDYDTSYFYEYVLPYRLLNEPLSFWRDSLAANYSYLRQPGIRSSRGYKLEAEQAAYISCACVLSEFASNKEALVFRQEGDSVSFIMTAYRPEQKIVYLCYSTGKKHSSAVVCLDGQPQDTIHFLPTQSITTFKPMRMYSSINIPEGEHLLTFRYLSGEFGLDYIHPASFFPLEEETSANYSGTYYRIQNKQTGNYITFDTLQASLLSPVEVKPLVAGDSCSLLRLDYAGYASWRIAAFKRDSIDLCCDVLGEFIAIDTPIMQWKYTNFNNQKWVFQPEGNGWVRIMSKDSGQYLEARTDKKTGQTTMVTHPYALTEAQLWKIEEAGVIPKQYAQPPLVTIGGVVSAAYRVYDESRPFEFFVFKGSVPPMISSLYHWKMGNCREEALYMVFLSRYMGIPATIDYTPHWANRGLSHLWSMIVGPDGKGVPFYIGAPPGDTSNPFHVYKKPKVLRRQFSINKQMEQDFRNESEVPNMFQTLDFTDVTSEYYETVDVIRNVPDRFKNHHIAYICVFDNKDWVPVYYGVINDGMVTFPRMAPDVAYIMAFYENGLIIPIGNPFIITKERKVEDVDINPSKKTTLTLIRKYPFMGKEDFFNFRMSGGRFQGSNRSDFKDAKDLYVFNGMTEGNWYEQPVNDSHAYRYLRYAGPNGSFCNINELEFYDTEGHEIKGEIFGSDAQPNGPIENVFDKNILTGFNAVSPDGSWVGLKLSTPTSVSKIRFIARNDGNCIEVGDEYELVYWDGTKWRGLGRQKAKNSRLVYKNVPANALYLLHNLTKGQEERIFTYENGRQIWW